MRGDEFLGASASLAAQGSGGPPDDPLPGASDPSASQVATDCLGWGRNSIHPLVGMLVSDPACQFEVVEETEKLSCLPCVSGDSWCVTS